MEHPHGFQMMTTKPVQWSHYVPFNALRGFKSIKLHSAIAQTATTLFAMRMANPSYSTDI